MNYTLLAENTTKRYLRVELRAALPTNNPRLYFYREDKVATSRLHSLAVHDKKGKELDIRRVSHGVWMIQSQKDTNVCISYVLHTFVMSPRETYVSADTWIINPKTSLITIEGMESSALSITLSSSENTFVSQKDITTDIEGLTLSYNTIEELYDTPLLGGKEFSVFSIGSSRLAIKGQTCVLDIGNICKKIEDLVDPEILNESNFLLMYLVSGHIDKKGLEYGEEHGIHSSVIIIPTTENLENEVKEKIIYSLHVHYYSKLSLSIEGILVPWFVKGFSYWNMIEKMKSEWTKEEYRLRVEQCYIRTFSLERELNETVTDSGYNEESTLSRDAGAVLLHQLNILFQIKGIKRNLTSESRTSDKLTHWIESNYSGDLTWLWSLSLHSKELGGWLNTSKKYISREGWRLECPKRGPVKVLYD
jgi:hypothetical protein